MLFQKRILELTQLGSSVAWLTQYEWSLSWVSYWVEIYPQPPTGLENQKKRCDVSIAPTSIDSTAGQQSG